MTSERWQRIESLYHSALELEPEKRTLFLAEACSDEAVRREVESLLKQESSQESELEHPGWETAPDLLQDLTRAIAPGAQLGPYKIEALIGAGGMGEVFRATDTRLHRTVAIKILPRDKMADPDSRHRFMQEARAASALNHPNIVTLHDIASDKGIDYLVMEYVPGKSLDKLITPQGLRSSDIIGYATQVASALTAAHAAGIVHRDIKPANIIVTAQGQVKVLDFGLAKLEEGALGPEEETLRSALTATGTVMGTTAYMSPEQVRGLTVDQRTDLFSFGVVLYEMVTGKRPFTGNSAAAVADAILNAQPRDFGETAAPGKLKTIVRRLLEKDRANRYETADRVQDELKALENSLAPSLQPGVRLGWWVSSAAAVLAFVVVGVWYVVKERHVRWAREQAIPQIERWIAEDNYLAAFDLGREAEKRIPTDPRLASLWPQMSRTLSIETDPPGAAVSFKKYAASESEWHRLGVTPLTKVIVPQGLFEWTMSKAGYEGFHGTISAFGERVRVPLSPKGSVPPGMVKIPGGEFQVSIATFGQIGPIRISDYFVDRYEVTNREFKQFVDRGGYQSQKYWKEPFQKDGRTVSWQEAMSEFRDATGRPGPATWEIGTYREGEDDFPVSGVSWYEAAAYAEFVGKKLPTVAHWYRAAVPGIAPFIIPASNFSSKGPARVGQYSGISPEGTYDMAGNVKEWTWNDAGRGLRFALGGAWSDPPYMFYDADARPPFDRPPTIGFRCVRYTSPPAVDVTGPVKRNFRDFSREKPVDEKLFRTYKSVYEFEPNDLKPSVDSVDDKSPYWRVEKVSYQTAYGNQRMTAYLFLPKNASPAYSVALYFPNTGALFSRSSSNIPAGTRVLDFVIRSGRALLYPVYEGSYERSLPDPYPEALLRRRERYMHWSQDVRRSVDYLATRRDLDLSRLVYYGDSLGARVSPIMISLEPRFKAGILLDGGLGFHAELPEADPINFVPNVKIPVLMVNGDSDYTLPTETSQAPLFRMLGTQAKDKRYVVFGGAHGIVGYRRNEVVREVLAWLDKYAPIARN
jgi:serine/threonine protein kinase/formylglycine-generating enzyme required for sulfatase activity/dienelactone hydrolase